MIVCHCNLITEKEIEETIIQLLEQDPWTLIVPAKVYHTLQSGAALRLLPKCGGNDHSGHRTLPFALGGERNGYRFTPGPRPWTAGRIWEQKP